MEIIKARQTDADFIADCVMEAVGKEICSNLAGKSHTLADVKQVFSLLAAREDTQYSYLNTLLAVDENGRPIGAIVGYDGEKLHAMREHFFAAAREILEIEMGDMDDECDGEEFYFDTLAVVPEHRGKGIARELLIAMGERARDCGKPAGLLVEKSKPGVRALYESVGFRKIGDRPFAYVVMDHMRM